VVAARFEPAPELPSYATNGSAGAEPVHFFHEIEAFMSCATVKGCVAFDESLMLKTRVFKLNI
jgi:hypothetical protein